MPVTTYANSRAKRVTVCDCTNPAKRSHECAETGHSGGRTMEQPMCIMLISSEHGGAQRATMRIWMAYKIVLLAAIYAAHGQ